LFKDVDNSYISKVVDTGKKLRNCSKWALSTYMTSMVVIFTGREKIENRGPVG